MITLAPEQRGRTRSPTGVLGLAGLFLFLLVVGYALKGLLLVVDPKRNTTFAQFRIYRFDMFTGLLAGIGLASAVIGFVVPLKARVRALTHTRVSSAVIAWSGLVVAFMMFALLVVSAGVSPAALRPFSATTRAALLEQYLGRGYIGLAISMAPLFLLLLPVSAVRRWPRWAATAAVILMFSLLGSRLYLLGTLFSLFLFHIRASNRRWSIGRQLVLVVSIGLCGAGLGAVLFRGEASVHNPYDLAVRGMATFDMADTLAVVEDSPKRYAGISVMEDTLLTYVPRSLWSGKPVFYGAYRLQEVAFPGIGNEFQFRAFFPVGFLGESWLNFGLIGVALIPFATIRALRWLDRWSTESLANLAYLCFIGGQLLGLLRSPGQFVPYAVIGFIIFRCTTREVTFQAAVEAF